MSEPSNRWRMLLLILTGALLAISGQVSPSRAAPCPADSWCPETLPIPHSSIHAVWATTDDDVYAVGTTSGQTAIFHFDGSSWIPMNHPKYFGELRTVWGNGSDDVYAGGYRSPSTVNALPCFPLLLHYDGNSWMAIDLFPGQDISTSYYAVNDVWGTGPANVYVGGGPESGYADGFLHRFNGSAWSTVTPAAGYFPSVRSIWGSGSSDIYVVGSKKFLGGDFVRAVYHFDGSRWSTRTPPEADLPQSVWGSGKNDVFVVGYNYQPEPEPYYHFIAQYDGSEWKYIPPFTTYQLGYDTVWGSGPADVYVSGEGGLHHFDGKKWTRVSQDLNLVDAHTFAPSYFLAAGSGYDAQGKKHSNVLWRYDNRPAGKISPQYWYILLLPE